MPLYYIRCRGGCISLETHKDLVELEIKEEYIDNTIARVLSLPPLLACLSSRNLVQISHNILGPYISRVTLDCIIIRRQSLRKNKRLNVLELPNSNILCTTSSHSSNGRYKTMSILDLPNSLAYLDVSGSPVFRVKPSSRLVSIDMSTCKYSKEPINRECILGVSHFISYSRITRTRQKSIRDYKVLYPGNAYCEGFIEVDIASGEPINYNGLLKTKRRRIYSYDR